MRQMRDTQQHFSIRKLTVGAASVLIGISFLATANTNEVHADTLNDSTQISQTETKQSASTENTKTVQESSAQNVKTDNTETASEAAKSVAQSADVQTTKTVDASTENTTEQKSKSQNDPTALTQNPDANTKDATSASNTETDNANSQLSSKQKDSLVQSESKTTPSATQTKDTEQKQAPAETTVLNTKPGTEKDAQNLAESKVKKLDSTETNKLSATMQDGTTISISRDQVGAVDDTSNLVIHVTYHNVKQGDKYTLTIPYGSSYELVDPKGQKLQTFGTTTFANDKKGYIITNDFNRELTTGNIVSQTFELGIHNNNLGISPNITDIGDMPKTITLDKYVADKKTDSTSVSFTQVIAPEMAPTFRRVAPDPDKFSEVYPNVDSTYELDLNETDGINKGMSYPSGQANNVVNSGTTITVPVPPDFVLNEERTAEANNFNRQGDTTTIKQIGGKGGNIIVVAPKGSGRQNWEGTPGYRFVGHYETSKLGETSATGKITIKQIVTRYDGSTYTIERTIEQPWSEHLVKQDADHVSAIQIGVSGYSGNGEIPKDVDPNNPINIFTFKNENAFDIDHPELTLSFDNQLQINRITMPQYIANSSDTNNYQYKAVLSDGRTISGSLNPSGELKTDNGVFIKTVVLTPNILRAGADATWGPERIAAYGSLSDTVKAGDSVVTQMGAKYKMNINGKEVVSTTKPNAICMQTVTEPAAVATFGSYTYQTESSAGVQDAGYLSIVQSQDTLKAPAHLVEEPILYYVLPKNTTFNEQIGVTNINGAPNGAKIKPAISTFWVDDREVVKIDYTGTGIKVDTYGVANTQVHLDNAPLAAPGAYNWTVYAESKHIKLGNALATSTSDFNPAFTEGKTDNVYAAGGGQWGIGNATETGIISGAIGNKDRIPVTKGSSDDKGSQDMAFDFRVINHNQQLNNATAVIDLNDHNNDAFDFQVTGPITITEQDPNDHTQVLYSTSIFNKPATTVGAQPDLSGFKTADQMTVDDWKNVKAIAFKLGDLGDDTSSSIFRIHGRDKNLTTDVGKSYSYSTYLFGNEVSPSYADSSANPSITISGKSTIKYQVHYTDENGQAHTVALDDLNKTYNDNQDSMPDKATITDTFSDYAKTHNVIPDHYKLGDITIINGGKTWKTDDPNKTIGFGDKIQYYADGDTVQINLVPKAKGSVKVVYHDDTANSDINGYGYDPGSQYEDTTVNYTNNDIENTKTALTNQGYVWKTTDGSLPKAVAGNQDITVTVHFVHGTVNIDKDHPAGKYTRDDLQKSATRIINYVDGQGNKLKNSNVSTVVFNASGVLDKVTGNLVNLNNDGSIKDQNGALHWTYVVDGGSAQTGDSYNFDTVPVENTLSYDGGTYRFDHVDPNTELENSAIKRSTVSVNDPQNQTINVVYDLITYHVGEPVTQTVKRTINYLDGNDHSKTVAPQVVQTATLSRTQIIDDKGNIIGWGSVSNDGKSYTIDNSYKVDNGWVEVDSPDLSNEGYKPASVAQVNGVASVDENTKATVVNVYYDHQLVPVDENSTDKHGVSSDQLGKDVNETVHFVYTNGTKAKDDVIQNRHFTRTVTVDAVTNEIVPNGQYDIDWHLGNGEKNDYDPVAVDVINGYFADQANVPGQTVTQDNIEKTVTYKELGHVVAVDKDGNVIAGSDSPQFINDPSDPTKALGVDAPTVTNYHLASGQSSHVEPDTDLSKDVKVVYDKDQGSVKVVFHDDTTNQDLTNVGYNSGNADFDTPITYTTEQDLDNLTKKGYVYVSTDGVVPNKITANENTTVTVHMRHGVVEITGKTPTDQVPANTVDAAQPDKLTKEVTLTVNYVNNDGTPFTGTVPANAHQTITFNGTAYVDAVTGQLVNAKQENGQLVIDENNTKTPAVIWTSDKTSFDKVISPIENGYHVVSVSDHKDGNDVGAIGGINFDSANIEVTVTYAPDATPEPVQPTTPSSPTEPTTPVQPTTPAQPTNPVQPPKAEDSSQPTEPVKEHTTDKKHNAPVHGATIKKTKSNAKNTVRPKAQNTVRSKGKTAPNAQTVPTRLSTKSLNTKSSNNKEAKATLPQTGEKTTPLVWLGLGLASLAALIGLAGDRKRR